MLDPNLQCDTTITNNDDHVSEEAEIEMDNTDNEKQNSDERKDEDRENNNEDTTNESEINQNTHQNMSNDVQLEEDIEQVIEVRRSHRKRNQRMVIEPDQIGDCDDSKDIDYE